MKDKKLLIMGVSLIFMILINALAVSLPLNNISTQEISDSFKVYFVPAGYVFSIWGLIYFTQLFAFYKLYSGVKVYKNLINNIAFWFVLGNVANGIWLFFWHYGQIYLTLPAMLVLLLSLIIMYSNIKKYFPKVWALTVPFGIYLGWISVATVANATDVLYSLKWDGWGLEPQMWAGIMILIASVLGFLMVKLKKEYAYAGVIIWAIIGIAYKFSEEVLILLAVLAGIAFILVSILATLSPEKKKK